MMNVADTANPDMSSARRTTRGRTDPHRPGAIDPDAYTPVLYYATATTEDGRPVPSFRVNCEIDNRRAVKNADGSTTYINGTHAADGRCCVLGLIHVAKVKWAATGSIGKCSVCGARYVEGEVWRHEPTGEHIHLGHTCADKYQFVAEQGLVSEWRRAYGEVRSGAVRAGLIALHDQERAAFLAQCPGLADALKIDHRIVQDIATRFQQYRSLSDAQVKLVMKIAAEQSRTADERAAERHYPAPEGRVTFCGVVVSTKTEDGAYGTTYRMTVKVTTEAGETWLAWGTAPAALLDSMAEHGDGSRGHMQTLRGCEVEVTATLKRGRDAHFAIAKRPVGKVVKYACAAGTCEKCETVSEAAPAPTEAN